MYPTQTNTEEEAKAIATALKTAPLLGDRATKATVSQRMAGAQTIHLATHALMDIG